MNQIQNIASAANGDSEIQGDNFSNQKKAYKTVQNNSNGSNGPETTYFFSHNEL